MSLLLCGQWFEVISDRKGVKFLLH